MKSESKDFITLIHKINSCFKLSHIDSIREVVKRFVQSDKKEGEGLLLHLFRKEYELLQEKSRLDIEQKNTVE